MSSVTSANSVLLIGVNALYPVPQQIQGFAVEEIYSVDPLEVAETMMGVDGILTGGYVNVPVKVGYSLMADSASTDFFDTWYTSQRQIQDLYYAYGSITLPSLSKKYTLTKGILSAYPPIADGGRTLKGRKFTVTWQSINPASF